jgi:protoheme ferro-lyase
VDHIVVLALYPQYSCSTVAAVWDELARILATRRRIPGVTFIRDYADNELYIKALANSARASFENTASRICCCSPITASRSVSPMKGMIIRSAAAIPRASWFPPSACRRRR